MLGGGGGNSKWKLLFAGLLPFSPSHPNPEGLASVCPQGAQYLRRGPVSSSLFIATLIG